VHRTGELYGQFQTLEQQKETASLGMWVFLVTEILFFGGVFLAYTINRSTFPMAFGIAGNMLIFIFLVPVWWDASQGRGRRVEGRGKQQRLTPPNTRAPTLDTRQSSPSFLYRAAFWRLGLALVRLLPTGICAPGDRFSRPSCQPG